jgi:RNA polymerase sigma-70 factor (ECF subfamily)
MHDAPDETLVALAGRGREDAFEILVRRHQRKVAGIAVRFLGDPSDAEDVAQEVFLSVWESARRWRPEAKFTTWLYRVTANACLNRLRRRRPELVEGLDGRAGDSSSPGDQLERRETIASVEQAVQALPPNQRMALILKRFEGRSHREIAEALETTVPAVESLIQRAYEGLRERLSAGFSGVRC